MRGVMPMVIEVAVLALWFGAAATVAAVVAPALFAVLPTRALAGAVVGRILPVIFGSGIVVAMLAIFLERRAHHEWRWFGGQSAAGVVVVACVIAQAYVAPRIERVRQAIGGPVDGLPADDPRRVAFGRLHAESVLWLGLAMLAAAAAAVLAARAITKTD